MTNSWAGLLGLAVALAAGAPRAQVVPPRLPPETVTGGVVLLKVAVSAAGAVRGVDVLNHSPGFTEALEAAVRQWRLGPDEKGEERDVLVAGLFRPPTLPDLAVPAPPPPPAGAPASLPVPIRWTQPSYPPRALGDGVVIVEVSVGAKGTVDDVTVLLSSPAFDTAATDAARRWVFRPAVRAGTALPSLAYIVFGFRAPVTASRPAR